MSIIVDELEALVLAALPGEQVENADYLRQLSDRLSLTADDLDPDPDHRVGATVLITGNPVDGLSLTGPFATIEDAYIYTEHTPLDEWWAVALNAPEPNGEPR